MTDSLNLLPSQAKFQAKRIKLEKNVRLFSGLILTVWIMVMAVVLGLFWFGQKNLMEIKKRRDRAMLVYKDLIKEGVAGEQLKLRAKMVGKVLAERFEYGKTIKKMDKLFLTSKVTVENFDMKGRGVFALKGRTVGDGIDEVDKRITEINNKEVDDFEEAKMTSLSYSDGVWSFAMEVKTK